MSPTALVWREQQKFCIKFFFLFVGEEERELSVAVEGRLKGREMSTFCVFVKKKTKTLSHFVLARVIGFKIFFFFIFTSNIWVSKQGKASYYIERDSHLTRPTPKEKKKTFSQAHINVVI